jgi:hypothetical protein
MENKVEGPRNLGFVLSESEGTRSYETVTIPAGTGKLKAGTVLGAIAIGAAVAAAKAGNTGNGTISAIVVLSGAKVGVYQLRFTGATTWTLTDPEGYQLAAGANDVANANDIAFTTTAGGVAFVAGDGFDITVAKGSGGFVPSPATFSAEAAGAEVASAVLGYRVDATDDDVPAVVLRRDAEVKRLMLVFDASVDTENKVAAKLAQLAGANIHAR